MGGCVVGGVLERVGVGLGWVCWLGGLVGLAGRRVDRLGGVVGGVGRGLGCGVNKSEKLRMNLSGS